MHHPWEQNAAQPGNDVQKEIFEFLNQAEINFADKDRIFRLVQKQDNLPLLLSELTAMHLDKDLFGAITELLTAY